jgi:hypothetical protein
MKSGFLQLCLGFICLAGFCLAQDIDFGDISFDTAKTPLELEEKFSLYGYLIDYFQGSYNVLDGKFKDGSLGNAMLLRLKGDWRPEKRLRFHTELAYYMTVGNQNSFVLLQKLGLSSFSQSDFPLQDFNQRFVVDHAWGLANLGAFDMQFGKFPIAWGTGYVFNPTARVSVPPFLDMVTEDTPGALGLLPSFAVSDRIGLQAYLTFQDKMQKKTAFREDGLPKNLPYGLKLKGIVGAFDLSLSWFKEVIYIDLDTRPLDEILTESGLTYFQTVAANDLFGNLLAAGDTTTALQIYKDGAIQQMLAEYPENTNYRRTHFAGFDFAGAVWNFGVYGEFAARIPCNDANKFDLSNYDLSRNLEATLGFDYSIPGLDTDWRVEYYYQGIGDRRKEDYNIMTALTGERLVQSRNYLISFIEKPFLDYHKIIVAGVWNLNDGSMALLPGYSYQPYDNFELTLGAFILTGSRGSEFDGRYRIYDLQEVDLIENFSPYLRFKLSF